MKIANIISKSQLIVPEDFNVVDNFDSIIVGIPTLIVGYELTLSKYPDFDITKNLLENNTYWTFKKTENRDKFESDLNSFITMVYNELTKKILYIFIDPLQNTNKILIKVIRKIYSMDSPISLIFKEMIYIYGENFIFGINLKLLEYLSIDADKIKNKVRQLSYKCLEYRYIPPEYKIKIRHIDNQVKYIPYLFSKTEIVQV